MADSRSSSGSDSTLISATPASTREGQLCAVLPTPEKTIRPGGHAGGQGAADLALRHRVGPGAQVEQGLQDREVGVGLDREGDQRLAPAGAAQGADKRVAQHGVVPLQRGGGVDIDRRADGLGDLGQGDAFAHEVAVPVLEMVQLGAVPGLPSALGGGVPKGSGRPVICVP